MLVHVKHRLRFGALVGVAVLAAAGAGGAGETTPPRRGLFAPA
jgi:hypothetical protein